MIALIVTGVVLVISEVWYLIYRYVNLHGEYDACETWPFLWPVQLIRAIWPEREEPKAGKGPPVGTIQIVEVLDENEMPKYEARQWKDDRWWYLACSQGPMSWWANPRPKYIVWFDTMLEAQEEATKIEEANAKAERIKNHCEVVGEFKPGGSN